MKLNKPFIITSRLMAGLQVGNGAISIEYWETTSDGRTRYHYFIDVDDKEYEAKDLKSGAGGGGIQEGMKSLLCFLGAAAESYRYKMGHPDREPKNLDLFPDWVTEWAYQNTDELSMLQCELEENKELIEE